MIISLLMVLLFTILLFTPMAVSKKFWLSLTVAPDFRCIAVPGSSTLKFTRLYFSWPSISSPVPPLVHSHMFALMKVLFRFALGPIFMPTAVGS